MTKRFLLPITFLIAFMISLVAWPGPAPAAEKSNILVQIVNELTSINALSTAKDNMVFKRTFAITDGVGINKAESIFRDQRTLAASATEDIDLAGVLTDSFGTIITFTKVKAILVYAATANTNNVQVGGAATNAFINWVTSATDIIEVPPNGIFFLMNPTAAGYAVTAATGDILKITNGGAGTSVTYDIIIIGETT